MSVDPSPAPAPRQPERVPHITPAPPPPVAQPAPVAVAAPGGDGGGGNGWWRSNALSGLILPLAVAASVGFFSDWRTSSSLRIELQFEVNRLKERNTDLSKRIEKLEARQSSDTGDLAKAMTRMNATLVELSSQMRVVGVQLQNVERDVKSNKHELEQVRKNLRRLERGRR